jgi:hypothetical protein
VNPGQIRDRKRRARNAELRRAGLAPPKQKVDAKVYRFDSADVKRALHEAVLKHPDCARTPAGFVNAEITFNEETDRIIGARVWYTKHMAPGDNPELAVKV